MMMTESFNDIRESENKEESAQSTEPDYVPLRQLGYFLLVVGAIFMINAMEEGSYRTPWSVALPVTLAGLILWGWSLVKEKAKS